MTRFAGFWRPTVKTGEGECGPTLDGMPWATPSSPSVAYTMILASCIGKGFSLRHHARDGVKFGRFFAHARGRVEKWGWWNDC